MMNIFSNARRMTTKLHLDVTLTIYGEAGVHDNTTGRDTRTRGSDGTVQGNVQPASGNLQIIPEGLRATATDVAFIDPTALVKVGTIISDPDGIRYAVRGIDDWGDYQMLTLTEQTMAAG